MAAGSRTSPARGEDLLKLARTRVGQKYVFGVFVPKDNSGWAGPWDCAEFASWVVFQKARTLYGCEQDNGSPSTANAYTGYWGRDAKLMGEIISIEQAARTPGAAVLRLPQLGAVGHVVISDGAGGTVEAHSTATGVIQSSLAGRRWDMGILVPGIVYSQGSAVVVKPPAATILRLQTPMMTGAAVEKVQRALKAAGFDVGVVDGEFGPHTHAAVVAFQLSHGLLADGEVGPVTAAALGISI